MNAKTQKMNKDMPERTKTVLILEDEPDAGTLFSTIMQSLGFKPKVVANLNEAKTEIEQSGPYDLWFFDYNLPDGTSIELLKNRESENTAPIIICSAYLSEIEKKEASNLGVIKILPKPVNSQLIKEALIDQNLL